MKKSWTVKSNTLVVLLVAYIGALAAPALAGTSDAQAEARRHTGDKSINTVTFRSMDSFYPSEWVSPGRKTWKLGETPMALNPTVQVGEELLTFDQALDRTYTNALLVIKDGKVVYELYRNGSDENDQFMSWSIAKSVTSMLFGAALDRGLINSIEDPVDEYLPALKGTAYEGVALRHLLMMRDGTSYVEQGPGGASDLEPIRERAMHLNQRRFTDIADLGFTRTTEPGDVFNYSTLTATLLGRVVEEATGLTLAEATQQYLWRPAGMESPAFWLLDGELPVGRAVGGGAFNATARDFGRIGMLMLNDGRARRKQVLSEDWVRESTVYQGDAPVIKGAPRGYQYQWWTLFGTELFEAIGIYGQFLSVDPASNTVIVKMSHWPEKGGRQYNMDTIALFRAIRAELDEQE